MQLMDAAIMKGKHITNPYTVPLKTICAADQYTHRHKACYEKEQKYTHPVLYRLPEFRYPAQTVADEQRNTDEEGVPKDLQGS